VALRSSRSCDKFFSSKLESFLGGSNGGFSWNLNLSAVSDEDLGYLSFEPVRSDFSTHTKVALVCGKFRPSTFYKEICQFFIRDRFFSFFTFLFLFTKFNISLCFCNILLGFNTFPWIFWAKYKVRKKEKQAWGH